MLRKSWQLLKYQKGNSLFSGCFQNFSSTEAMDKSFLKFQTKYKEHVQSFKEKIEQLERNNTIEMKRTEQKVYTHPYHSEHHPLNFSAVKNSELFWDFVGPEQVSPHYENFMVARKYALVFFAGLFVLNFGVSTIDLHWIMKSTIIPWIFWFQLMYIYIEGRKSFFKPLLSRFYRRIASNEMHHFDVFYHENMENHLKSLIRLSKSQIEYWELNKEYEKVKSDSINNFLATQHNNLQKSISDRTINILKGAQNFEEFNKRKYINEIIEDAIKEIDRQLKGKNAEKIKSQIMNSAIEGISKGFTEFANDPLLPLIQEYIKKRIATYDNLTQQQKNELVELSKDQLNSLKQDDLKVKNDFLNTQPHGLDSSLKNNETVKKILSNWNS